MDLSQFGLKPLSLSDKLFIDNVLRNVDSGLSSYTFTSHYIWRDIFQFYWGIIDGFFCLFAVYGDYIYMPIPPVGFSEEPFMSGAVITKENENPPLCSRGGMGGLFSYEYYEYIISTVFSIMNNINHNPAVSRIENIDESQKEVFLSMGYKLNSGEPEHVYRREDLVSLKGNCYKSKRASYNYFIKNYQYSFEAFQTAHVEECMKLFEQWKMNRGKNFNDDLYQALLEDASYSHRQAITNHEAISLSGRIVKINNSIEGYTFGFGKGDTFYILMEITNPEIKGLSQFIFRELCRELEYYRFINTLGDSALTNLRKVKLSYRPYKVTLAWITHGV